MTKNAIILVIILLYLAFASVVIFYLFSYTNFLDWLALSALVFSGVIATERIAQWLSKIGEEPSLKIIGSTTEFHSKGSEGEYMEIFLIVKNAGGGTADDCKVLAMVDGVSTDFYYVTNNSLSLVPDEKDSVRFQQIIKSEFTTRSLTEGSPRLSGGKIYTFKIRFLGSNFKDKKLHTLKLDLSSWENIKVILDC